MKIKAKSFRESYANSPEDLAKYIANDFWMDPQGEIEHSLKYAKVFLDLSEEELSSMISDVKEILKKNYPAVVNNSEPLSAWINK